MKHAAASSGQVLGTIRRMEGGSGDGDNALQGLPRVRVVPPPPPAPTSAWSAAFEEASLLSPMASARSFSSKLPPTGGEGLRERDAAAEAASG